MSKRNRHVPALLDDDPHRVAFEQARAQHQQPLPDIIPRYEQACKQIAGLGGPGIAAPSAPGGLALRHDPERALLARTRARQSFGIGRAERVKRNETGACVRVGIKVHQNSDFAAAAAALMSGDGYTKKNSMNTPLIPSTSLRRPGIGAKASSGSSKYITLTIRR